MAQTQEIGWDLSAEHDLWKSICAPNSWFNDSGEVATHPRSLWWFVTLAWGARAYLASHPAEPRWLYEPIHGPYTEWLQYHILEWKRFSLTGKPGRYHIASVLPRGYGKTVTATKAASLWSHLDDPDMTSLISSGTSALSEDILVSINSVMNGEDEDSWFCWLYGNWRQGAREWTKKYVKHGYRRAGNISEPSFDTSAENVGSTGYHHRQNWIDDPIIKNKLKLDRVAYMRSVHDGVNAQYNSLHTNGLMAFTLTRYLDDDVAGRHFREEGIASWAGMPCPHMAIFDKVPFGEGVWHVFFYQTEDEITGEPTHPWLWTKKTIAEAKSRDPEDFACQQQNNPGSGEKAPLVESQLPYLYLSYIDFHWDVQIEWATVHIDTAFKSPDTIRTGDDSAIVVWLKDARNNGILYLDTDLLRSSNEWREEDFNKELLKVLLNLRRRGIFIRAITDEVEPGGKSGTYKNRILGILRAAGFNLSADNFIQLNRHSNKKGRIRTAAGHWAEGYVRVLVNKVDNKWAVTPAMRKLFNQIIRVDVVQHDDLADAATDGFIPQLWRMPTINPGIPQEEGTVVRRPWDDDLKDIGKPLSNLELVALLRERDELAAEGQMTPGHGFDDDGWLPPREPV